jgi:hypothetical protein
MLKTDPVLIMVAAADRMVSMIPDSKTVFSTGYVLARTTALNGIVTLIQKMAETTFFNGNLIYSSGHRN